MTKADNPSCVRCNHRADDHTLDDASGFSPSDPGALFRCCWPVKHGGKGAVIECDCPDFVVPADAGWPYNDAPEPA